MNRKDIESRERIRRDLEEMEKEGYRYAGEGDSPYSQDFVDSFHGRKRKKE